MSSEACSLSHTLVSAAQKSAVNIPAELQIDLARACFPSMALADCRALLEGLQKSVDQSDPSLVCEVELLRARVQFRAGELDLARQACLTSYQSSLRASNFDQASRATVLLSSVAMRTG